MLLQQAFGTLTPAVVVQNLSKTYTDSRGCKVLVLNDISFEIRRGEILGIFGPSACGKTTLLRILSGVLEYTGNVAVFGEPAASQKGLLAYVPQGAELLEWRTLRSNALLGYQLTRQRRHSPIPDITAYSTKLFEQFGILDAIDKYPRQCSGGQRQRAALIRAFLTPASLVVLDEPGGGIDHISRSRIYQTLLNFVQGEDGQKTALTVVIVSHDPEELIFLCDRILVMPAKGRPLLPVTIDFPRPRNNELKFSAEFAGYKRSLLESIR